MPVCICPPDIETNHRAAGGLWTGHTLTIGLINNMPDAALRATERQFITLLEAAAGSVMVRLSLYTLPEIARSESEIPRMANIYTKLGELWDRQLDGIIVTGTEPARAELMDEPYWGNLTAVIDWAERNTFSSVWSCLAAHAAVLRISGIPRRRLTEKLNGVFQYTRVSRDALADRLTNGVPDRLSVPHSRWNDIGAGRASDELATSGYHVLTRSETEGIDAFIMRQRTLFLLFQGHPEYGTDSLLLEYRRDVHRYLMGEGVAYPSMPRNYFDDGSVGRLEAFGKRAVSDRRRELLEDFPIVRPSGEASSAWRTSAVRIYRNWLMYLYEQKAAASTGHAAIGSFGNHEVGECSGT